MLIFLQGSFRVKTLPQQNLGHRLIASCSGINGSVCSLNVVSGLGGRGIVYFNLREKLQHALISIGGHGDVYFLNLERQPAIYGHGGYGNVCFLHLMLTHQLQNLMPGLIASGSGINRNVSQNVAFGVGGGHGIAYFSQKVNLPLAHFGIGGLGVAYFNNPDKLHAIGSHGGLGHVYSNPVLMLQSLALRSGIPGNVYSRNAVFGVGGGPGIAYSSQKTRPLPALFGTGGQKDACSSNQG